jgi:hypothetical protein
MGFTEAGSSSDWMKALMFLTAASDPETASIHRKGRADAVREDLNQKNSLTGSWTA